ncbi:MAG TPA: hypothetical protein VIZ31_08630 [Vicinamibacteria bacterium]
MKDETLASADALHGRVVRAGENARAQRDLLDEFQPDETLLVSLLRRAVPLRFLEVVAATRPFCDRVLVVAQVVLNPRTPRGLSLRLLPQLFWRQLAEVAVTPHVPAAVRVKAEGSLKDQLRNLRLGERVALARIATPALIQALLEEAEPKVLAPLLDNPRLREEDLLAALRRPEAPAALIQAVAGSTRWSLRYFVRLELVLQARTPLPIAMLQLSSLVKRDLRRVAEARGLRPLVQVAAERLLGRDESPEGSGT